MRISSIVDVLKKRNYEYKFIYMLRCSSWHNNQNFARFCCSPSYVNVQIPIRKKKLVRSYNSCKCK
jgi:hypothetical protein